jgi:hypothetical protein
MIELQDGILVNPELIQCVEKFYLADKVEGQYGLQLHFIRGRENYYFATREKRDEAYRKLYNATAGIRLTNTVTTSEERHWDL